MTSLAVIWELLLTVAEKVTVMLSLDLTSVRKLEHGGSSIRALWSLSELGLWPTVRCTLDKHLHCFISGIRTRKLHYCGSWSVAGHGPAICYPLKS